jgi:uncharacterized cupredoxin-like copper-binding protein
VVLLALSTGHKLGLGLAVAGFAGFALIVSMLVPRYRPQFPGRGLGVFLAACVLLFIGMLAAVEIFGKEGGEAKAGAGATTETTGTTTTQQTTTSTTTTQKAEQVQVSESEFKITLAGGSVKAGHVIFEVKNEGHVPHNLVVDGNGVHQSTKNLNGGQSEPLRVDLKPGTYDLYCSIPGHKQAGMDLKLTVS